MTTADDTALDRIDRNILRILQAEGRLTNQALADRVALSPSACLARVRRLERVGAIQSYHARLDPFALDIGLVLYAEISLSGSRSDEMARFEAAMTALPQVVEISDVSGDVDYILKVVVGSISEWNRLREQLTGGDLGVERVTTHVLMRKPKIFVGYPVPDR